MRVILNGACGRMGRAVGQLLSEGKRGMELAVGVDLRAEENDPGTVKTLGEYRGEADVLIDFSHHSCVGALLDYAVSRGLPCVIATTGHTEEEKAEIAAAAEKIPLFLSANMSMGVAVLASFAKTAAALLPDARCRDRGSAPQSEAGRSQRDGADAGERRKGGANGRGVCLRTVGAS